MKDEKKPLVSVIVPVYNVERYLDCCLDSIRDQSYQRLEIIMVEDCSTDGSLSMLERHLADPRVRLLRHKRNSGLSAARNTGIEAATGDFVLFVDSDDVIAHELVDTCLSHALETGADLVVFDFVAFKDGDDLPEVNQAVDTIGAEPLGGVEYFKLPHFAWLKFISADLLNDPRLRFPVGAYYEDWPFHWELGFSSGQIVRLSGYWYCYRQRVTSITSSMGRKLLDQFVVQRMVLQTVRLRGDSAESKVFSEKVYEASWSVLMKIDINLLSEAIEQAKGLQSELRLLEINSPRGIRAKLLAEIISVPYWLSILSVRLLRGIKTISRVKPRVLGSLRFKEVP
ncbi:glycosyltransferase family 2 protein [Billgrantia montanilacus]|uniref:Glycosyltransferase n=1 Tax=Billgrantia montanilacus TaxID=2282305 RepID=A0A368U1X4_9GAMM|nr:glycosyltransferase family 2 protein [Halomonas montanilacus]RCV91014.1 glycosyltransferase [Halomonas montanilacus]